MRGPGVMVKLRKPALSIFHHEKHTSQVHLWEKSPVESALVFVLDVPSPPLTVLDPTLLTGKHVTLIFNIGFRWD